MDNPILISRLISGVLMLSVLAPITKVDGFTAIEYQRQTIYHSPQTPGFTCWVNAWTMRDGSLMVSFTQATGPVAGRPKAPRMCRKNWMA